MLAKLVKALDVINSDVKKLKFSVQTLQKLRAIVKDGAPGRDGKDGVTPELETIVNAVLARIPTPKDGVNADPKAVLAEVLLNMPKPRDGRDSPQISVTDVAAIVLAKIPKPRDGYDGPDLNTVVKEVRAQVNDGKQGLQGKPGKDGKDGVSVTAVKLTKNELFISLDGKRKSVGKINLPVPIAPFRPGNDNQAGGGTARHVVPTLKILMAPDVVPVFSKADLPLADETGLIVLPPPLLGVTPATYHIYTTSLNLGSDRLFLSQGVNIIGMHPTRTFILSFTFGDLFTIEPNDIVTRVQNMSIFVPFGDVYSQNSAVGGGIAASLSFIDCNIFGCVNIATLNNTGAVFIDTVVILGVVSRGFLLSGTGFSFQLINSFVFDVPGKFIDWGTSVYEVINFSESVYQPFDGTVTPFDGLPDSGNIAVGGHGIIRGLNILGPVTDSLNILPSDIRWDFNLNNTYTSSMNREYLSMVANATETVIADGAPIKVAGVWTLHPSVSSRFSSDSTGRVTYIGVAPILAKPDVGFTYLKAGSGVDSHIFGVTKNQTIGGVFNTDVRTSSKTDTSREPNISFTGYISMVNGDYIELWADGVSTTDNVTVFGANMTVEG